MPRKPTKPIDIHGVIIRYGLMLLGIIWLGFGVITWWQNTGNSEEQLCLAFPDKCPKDSPFLPSDEN